MVLTSSAAVLRAQSDIGQLRDLLEMTKHYSN
jgi:hypothetical protein